jgi:2-polyprenyl-6-methoxyphenol hydroxylase-like FAD-dependent oxidoreductase
LNTAQPLFSSRIGARQGATLTDFGNGDGVVRAHIDGHGVVEADVLVVADGAQSPTRRRFLPDLSGTYAGYVA